MKRLVLISAVLVCCLTCALGEEKTAVVTTEGARLPMLWMPLPSSSVVGFIPDGETVIVEREDEEWCLVTFERKSGYVRAGYLRSEPAEIGDAFIRAQDAGTDDALQITQNRARDIADVALSRVYPDFLPSEYGVVQVTYRENTAAYGTYYGFEYFCADGSRSYRCYVDAYTGGILKLLPPGN